MRAMKLFKVTHPWNRTGNMVLMVYDTCLVMKIFTIGLPAECELLRSLIGFNIYNLFIVLSRMPSVIKMLWMSIYLCRDHHRQAQEVQSSSTSLQDIYPKRHIMMQKKSHQYLRNFSPPGPVCSPLWSACGRARRVRRAPPGSCWSQTRCRSRAAPHTPLTTRPQGQQSWVWYE